MATTSTSLFAGNSRYATDFQAVIDRAVAIASLPLNQYRSQQSALENQSTALTSLTGKFTALRSALDPITRAVSGANRTATSSKTSVVTATTTAEAAEGTYTIDVRDAGSTATALSTAASVIDPNKTGLSSSGSFTLTVATDPGTDDEATEIFTINPSGTSLNALRDAINSEDGLDIRATIVNVGTSGAPDYRLSLQSTTYAPQEIQLNDGAADLLDAASAGARVKYRLNGGTTDYASDSRDLALSSGLTVKVASADAGSPVTITVAQDSASLRSALAAFATAYNAAVDEMDKHRGSTGGALAGNTILNTLTSALQQTMFYESGDLSMSQIGLVLDKSGHLSLDSTLFSEVDLSDLTSFLGSSSSGFLATATSALESLTDQTAGALTSASDVLESSLELQEQRISDAQERIDALQARLEAQMAAADALVAQLEQQATYMNNMFKAMSENSN